jgi:hypothetical protein
MEYLELGRTSDFTPVGLTLVTSENVIKYQAQLAGSEEGK